MDLGNKILEFRKKNSLSQEELAEKLNVTRQTISKWELNGTSPDITQAKELSKIFKISLDELVDNDIRDILTEKISNTERLAGLTIKILKFFGFFTLTVFTFYIIYKLFYVSTYAWFVGDAYDLNCTLDGKTYSYKVSYETRIDKNSSKNKNIINEETRYKIGKLERMEGSSYLGGIIDIEKYEYYDQFEEAVYGYFEQNGGNCSFDQ